MTKKNTFKLSYNAPFTITLCAVSLIVFLIDKFAFKGSLMAKAFICRSHTGAIPFDFKNIKDYITLLSHALGNSSISTLLLNMILALILGPVLEERYGSPVMILMSVITTLIAGVLTACLGNTPLSGFQSIVIMMIFLSSLQPFQKKDLQISWIAVIIFYLVMDFIDLSDSNFTTVQKLISPAIELCAGLAGSLFGFLSAPKKKPSSPKKDKPSLLKKASEINSSKTKAASQINETDETIVDL